MTQASNVVISAALLILIHNT